MTSNLVLGQFRTVLRLSSSPTDVKKKLIEREKGREEEEGVSTSFEKKMIVLMISLNEELDVLPFSVLLETTIERRRFIAKKSSITV